MSARIDKPEPGQAYNLKDVRTALRYDVVTLAAAAHVTPQFILHLESGNAKHRTSRTKARQIAKVLNVSLESIDWPNGLTPDPNVRSHTKADPRVNRGADIPTSVCNFGHIQPLNYDPIKGCELCQSQD